MSMNNNGAASGASSNTPPFTPNCLSTCVDYLKVRVNFSYEDNRERFKTLLFDILHIYDYEMHRDKGRNAYETTCKLAVGTTLSFGGRFTITRDGFHTSLLEMTGLGCRDFELRYLRSHKDLGYLTNEYIIREGWIKLFEELISMGGVCTRIDLPTDDYSGNITISEMKEKIKRKEYTTRLKKFEETNSNEEVDDEEDIGIKEPDKIRDRVTTRDAKQTGFSGTFGTRNKLQLCIYDKAAEQHNKGNHILNKDWIRYEVRYYHKNAEQEFMLFYDALKRHKEHQHIIGCLTSVIEFKESIGDNTLSTTHKHRNETWSKWKNFINVAEKHAGFATISADPTLKSNAKWLKREASFSFGKVATVIDAPCNQMFYAYINYFLNRMTKEHLQVINQYLRSKNRPVFESIEAVKVYHKSRPDYPDEICPEVIELVYQIDKEYNAPVNLNGEESKDDK